MLLGLHAYVDTAWSADLQRERHDSDDRLTPPMHTRMALGFCSLVLARVSRSCIFKPPSITESLFAAAAHAKCASIPTFFGSFSSFQEGHRCRPFQTFSPGLDGWGSEPGPHKPRRPLTV